MRLSDDLPADLPSARLERAKELITELMDRVRELSLNVRPSVLDDLGLLPALAWYFERYTLQTGVHVVFRHSAADRRFRSEVETAAFRVVQEALTNVVRHAGVAEVRIDVRVLGQRLVVTLRDLGAGFDPDASLRRGDTVAIFPLGIEPLR